MSLALLCAIAAVSDVAAAPSPPPLTAEEWKRSLDEWHAPDAASIATWVNSGAISDAVHDESEVTPEDYMWQKLPGRCCFSGMWDDSKVDAEGKSLWVSVKQCSECSVWGQADASCHNGADSCKECGMDLYCPGTPPPLLGGAKVCTGSSRVGEGCNDVYKMGVCMDKSMDDCMRACQANKASLEGHTTDDRTQD